MSVCLGCQTALPDPDGPCPKCGAVIGTEAAPKGEVMLDAVPSGAGIELADGPIEAHPRTGSSAPNPLIASLTPISRGPVEMARPPSLPPKPTFEDSDVERVAHFEPPPSSWWEAPAYRSLVKKRLGELNTRLEIREKIMVNARHELEDHLVATAEQGMKFVPSLSRESQRAYYSTTEKLNRLAAELKAMGPDDPSKTKVRESYRESATGFGQVVLENEIFGTEFTPARQKAVKLRQAASAAEKDVLVHEAAINSYDVVTFDKGATVLKIAVVVILLALGGGAAFVFL